MKTEDVMGGVDWSLALGIVLFLCIFLGLGLSSVLALKD